MGKALAEKLSGQKEKLIVVELNSDTPTRIRVPYQEFPFFFFTTLGQYTLGSIAECRDGSDQSFGLIPICCVV